MSGVLRSTGSATESRPVSAIVTSEPWIRRQRRTVGGWGRVGRGVGRGSGVRNDPGDVPTESWSGSRTRTTGPDPHPCSPVFRTGSTVTGPRLCLRDHSGRTGVGRTVQSVPVSTTHPTCSCIWNRGRSSRNSKAGLFTCLFSCSGPGRDWKSRFFLTQCLPVRRHPYRSPDSPSVSVRGRSSYVSPWTSSMESTTPPHRSSVRVGPGGLWFTSVVVGVGRGGKLRPRSDL